MVRFVDVFLCAYFLTIQIKPPHEPTLNIF